MFENFRKAFGSCIGKLMVVCVGVVVVPACCYGGVKLLGKVMGE